MRQPTAEEDGDPVREFFKRWPGFYYFVMVVLGPGLLMNLSAAGFLKKYPRSGKTLNVGSGPRILAGVVNVDITPYPGVDLVGDAAALPVEAGSVARLVYDTVLEHVDKPESVIAEAARVLEQGGLVYASVPFMYPFHSSPSDYTRWTSEGIKNLCERYGLSVVEEGIRTGPFSILVLWLCYFVASLLCFGSKRLYTFLLNVTLLLFFPIKIFDIIAARLPFAENFSSILYIVVKKQ